MSHFWNVALLGAALTAPVALTPTVLRADDPPHRSYHDKHHKDDHEWNEREDRAYRMYLEQNHRKYGDFDRLKERERENYWKWRHEHNDSILKIEIK